MNNQNSEKENPSPIYFSPIGGDLPPIEENNRVYHPSHYTWLKELCGIEVIDITRHMDFDLGNAVKYILRQGRKHEEGISDKEKAIEDLEKAIWYINDRIKQLKGESSCT